MDTSRARDLGHDVISERIRETVRGKGESTGDVQRDKLIAEMDLKLLAVWSPTRFGNKIDVVSGGERIALDETAVAAKIAAYMAIAQARKDEADAQ